MENVRKKISEEELEVISGGSIVFNGAHTTCGRDCNNQYTVNDYDKVIDYIIENRNSMREKTMLANMADLGYITKIVE